MNSSAPNTDSGQAGKPFYETERALSEYLLFHYGQPGEILPWEFGPRDALDFPRRCVEEMLDLAGNPAFTSALDLGCAVGRSSFELARRAERVIGIDYSTAFIKAANRLKETGIHPYRRVEEGDLTTELAARVPEEIDRSRVCFETGDACDLRKDLGRYDLVLLANLIDRLPRPQSLLERLPSLTNPGGHIIITSPYTWLEEHTPRGEWLPNIGGTPGQTTFEALERFLSPTFELAGRKPLPFLIREHARKYQWSVAEGSLWRLT